MSSSAASPAKIPRSFWQRLNGAPIPPARLLAAYPVMFSISGLIASRVALSGLPSTLLGAIFTRFVSAENVPLAALATLHLQAYLFTVIPAVVGRATIGKGLDNNYPREQKKLVTGLAARLQALHENTLESFAGYAAAILVARITNVPLDIQTNFSLYIVLGRLLYAATYVFDLGTPRSIAYVSCSTAALALYGYSLLPGFDGFLRGLVRA
ncbi:hypothetical protein GQ42DRAFT_165664 [Ramicandelaber brevisporus]|nr:hypothetical protein GQ42DRAFT_165664 [Ramicandelaber brevisporus]